MGKMLHVFAMRFVRPVWCYADETVVWFCRRYPFAAALAIGYLYAKLLRHASLLVVGWIAMGAFIWLLLWPAIMTMRAGIPFGSSWEFVSWLIRSIRRENRRHWVSFIGPVLIVLALFAGLSGPWGILAGAYLLFVVLVLDLVLPGMFRRP